MTRKTVSGPLRDRERTKDKLLKSVGKIIATKGFHALKVTNIATTAAVDKKLIYEYFGSVEALIGEYLRSTDFGSKFKNLDFPDVDVSDHGKLMSKTLIRKLHEAISESRELQRIIVWQLYEYNEMLEELCERRETLGDAAFKAVMHPHFRENHKKYRAVLAILISSAYFLNIHADSNGSRFCGLDIRQSDDKAIFDQVTDDLIDFVYEKYASDH